MIKSFVVASIILFFNFQGVAQELNRERLIELIDEVYSSTFKVEASSTHFRYFTFGEIDKRQKFSVLVNQGKIIDSLQASKFYFSEKSQEIYQLPIQQKKVVNFNNSFGSEDYCLFSDDIIKINSKYIKIENRQFISPFGKKGMSNYDFFIDSLSVSDGVLIKIVPKKQHKFLLKTTVLLSANLDQLKEINFMSENCKIPYVDSISINLSYQKEGGVNVLFAQKVNYWGYFYGYESVGSYSVFFENYEFENYDLPIKKNNEVLLIDNSNIEADYSVGNMLCCLDTSRATNINAKIKSKEREFLSDVLFDGYYHIQKNGKNTYYFSPLVYFPQFDAYQGWTVDQQFVYKHFFKENKSLEAFSNIRYNMSFNKLLGKSHLTFLLSPKKQFKLLLNGGSYVRQTSQKDPFNLTSWLLYIPESSLSSKVYDYKYVKVGFSAELFNGVYFKPMFEYSNRASIAKTQDYPFNYNYLGKEYINNFDIASHRYSELSLELKYTPSQKYFYQGNKKIIITSHLPTYKLEYHRAIKGIYNSVPDFEKIGFSIEQRLHSGSLGFLKYKLQFQKFLSFNSGSIIDHHHIQSSRILLYDDNPIDNVFLLEYYEIDNKDYYFQFDISNDYNSLLTSKVPFLKKFKCSFTTEFHYIVAPLVQYSELVLGLNHVFKRLKISYAIGLFKGESQPIHIDEYTNDSRQLRHGIRVGILLDKAERL